MRSQASFDWQKPSIPGRRAQRFIVQRRDERAEPEGLRPRVSVGKNKYFAFRVGFTDGRSQVMHLLTAIDCRARDDDADDRTNGLVKSTAGVQIRRGHAST